MESISPFYMALRDNQYPTYFSKPHPRDWRLTPVSVVQHFFATIWCTLRAILSCLKILASATGRRDHLEIVIQWLKQTRKSPYTIIKTFFKYHQTPNEYFFKLITANGWSEDSGWIPLWLAWLLHCVRDLFVEDFPTLFSSVFVGFLLPFLMIHESKTYQVVVPAALAGVTLIILISVSFFAGCKHCTVLDKRVVHNWPIQFRLVQLKAMEDEGQRVCYSINDEAYALNKTRKQLLEKIDDLRDHMYESAIIGYTQRRRERRHVVRSIRQSILDRFRETRKKTSSSTYSTSLPVTELHLITWLNSLNDRITRLTNLFESGNDATVKCEKVILTKEVRLCRYHFDPTKAKNVNYPGFTYIFSSIYWKTDKTKHDPIWALARGFYLSRSWNAFSMDDRDETNEWRKDMERQRRIMFYIAYAGRRKHHYTIDPDNSQVNLTSNLGYRRFLVATILEDFFWCITFLKYMFHVHESPGEDYWQRRSPSRFYELYMRIIHGLQELDAISQDGSWGTAKCMVSLCQVVARDLTPDTYPYEAIFSCGVGSG